MRTKELLRFVLESNYYACDKVVVVIMTMTNIFVMNDNDNDEKSEEDENNDRSNQMQIILPVWLLWILMLTMTKKMTNNYFYGSILI